MKRLLLLLWVLPGLTCWGQSTERHWEAGPLTWEDFGGEPFRASAYASELDYEISYEVSRKRFRDTTVVVLSTKNYMLPQFSWVKPAQQSDQLLRYNQVIFDIVEQHRRNLQRDLHRIDHARQAEGRLRAHHEDCQREIELFQRETQSGADPLALADWERQTAQALAAHPFERFPEIEDRNFGCAFSVGLGAGAFTSDLSDHLTPTFNYLYGLDLSYKNTVLFLDVTLARNRVRRAFVQDNLLWPEDLPTLVAVADLRIGQVLVNSRKHKLTPFAGLSILELSANDRTGDTFADHLVLRYGVTYGLQYDFKVWKMLHLIPAFGVRINERAEHLLRVRMYAVPARFDQMRGTFVNLSVGYTLSGRLVRVR